MVTFSTVTFAKILFFFESAKHRQFCQLLSNGNQRCKPTIYGKHSCILLTILNLVKRWGLTCEAPIIYIFYAALTVAGPLHARNVKIGDFLAQILTSVSARNGRSGTTTHHTGNNATETTICNLLIFSMLNNIVHLVSHPLSCETYMFHLRKDNFRGAKDRLLQCERRSFGR